MAINWDLSLLKRYEKLLEKERQTVLEIERLSKLNVSPTEKLNDFLVEKGTSALGTGCKMTDLIRRPQINYNDLAPFDPDRPELDWEVCEQVELQIKYEGYIQKQLAQIEQMRKMESKKLPPDLDYSLIYGLRLEAVEKLNKIKPLSIGQASRISGVSPADVSMLAVWLMHEKGEKNAT